MPHASDLLPSGEAGLRLAGALWPLWDLHGHYTEGRGWLERALKSRSGASAALRAKALNGAGVLARRQSDYATARLLHEESLTIRRALGNQRDIASTLGNLGQLAATQGDYAAARPFYEESLTIYRELGDKRGIALALTYLGFAAYEQGEYETAHSLLEESLPIHRELGEKWGISYTLSGLGHVARVQGKYTLARRLYAESLMILKELGIKYALPFALEAFGYLAAAERQGDRVARLFGAGEVLREANDLPLPADAEYNHSMAAAHAALGEEAFAAAWAQGRAMTLEQAVAYALEETRPP